MEVWAGVECTVNRVGDRYFDQLAKNAHHDRIADLDLFAGLGITAIRYPVLWERTAPDGLASARWEWSDERLDRLQVLNIRPIVGLVHHGSGPPSTNLLDPTFPEQLAEYAYAVARRYPWVAAYTPVNEPLTTARFSGLYGYWYPHARDEASFYRMVINQCRGVMLAMQAIRSVNPQAELVQTEDLGVTYSTPRLAYQAKFENDRRLLSLDLLCGLVTEQHPLWVPLLTNGIREVDLLSFSLNPCRPDVIGLNYYLTSDRFIDERMDRYPDWLHGGNHRERYADIEAVRVWNEGITGFGSLLAKLWHRYRRSVAITEVHLGCTREEQLRWLKEAWNAAQNLQTEGADVRAVTVWSLLGAYDWNRLVVEDTGFYEPGVFDLRGASPRPTALAAMMKVLAKGREFTHAALESKGWWRLASRFHYAPLQPELLSARDGIDDVHDGPIEGETTNLVVGRRGSPAPILILGAGGTLGAAFVKLCGERSLASRGLFRHDLDVADSTSVAEVIKTLSPWAVINAAGYVRVDQAETDREQCLRTNTIGAATVATICERLNISYLTFSSDLVFDGTRSTPYVESHPVSPLNVYGRSKAEAERQVLHIMPSALIIRTSAFFGPWDSANFVATTLERLSQGLIIQVSANIVSPTYVPDLVHTCLDLLIDGESGVWHLANRGYITWADLARQTAGLADLDPFLVEEHAPMALGLAAPRPPYSALGSERGTLLPSLDNSLARCISAWQRRAHEPLEHAMSRSAC